MVYGGRERARACNAFGEALASYEQAMVLVNEIAAPIPGEIPDPEASNFLDTIRSMFREAAEATGAKVLAS